MRGERGVQSAKCEVRGTSRRRFVLRTSHFALLLLAACSVTPLSRRLGIGAEAYVVFVGESRTGDTDLFAVTPAGGRPIQFTFTRAAETHPALAPGGAVVAFLRKAESEEVRHVIFLNLLNGTEREVILPAALGNPEALGWATDGSVLYLRTGTGLAAVTPPPAEPSPRAVTGAESARADSALSVLLGTPAFARVDCCPRWRKSWGSNPAPPSPPVASTRTSPSPARPFRNPARWS